MFQPNPKPLLTTIIKAKAPIWLIAAAFAAQIAIMEFNNSREPSCSLKVHNPHYSTSMNRNLKTDSIKLNITSECNQPQLFTEISSQIQQIDNGKVSIFTFNLARQGSSSTNKLVAEFKNLWKPCKRGSSVELIGSAKGYVHLLNGKSVQVSGSSEKYHPESCRITAD